jgi:phosphohistidine phosphatase
MPREIWLLRHGDAEPPGPDTPDEARKLTPEGVEQARAAGRAFAALGLRFAYVFTSPRVRAQETAMLASEPLDLMPVVHPPLSERFTAEDAFELVLAGGPDAAVLAVGHEPDFSRVVHDLTGGRIVMKKGGVAAIQVDGSRTGKLIALLRPRELELIGQ